MLNKAMFLCVRQVYLRKTQENMENKNRALAVTNTFVAHCRVDPG